MSATDLRQEKFVNASLTICPNRYAVARVVAARLVSIARRVVDVRGRVCVAFPGGSTPKMLYSCLREEPFVGEMPWGNADFFVSDERMVDLSDDQSNMGNLKRLLLDPVGVSPKRIHQVQSDQSPDTAARSYEDAVTRLVAPAGVDDLEYHGVDIALVGLGTDGHVASIFPGSTEGDARVVSVHFDYEDRPGSRITFTSSFLSSAGNLMMLVTGQKKAGILARVLTGKYEPVGIPAQRLLSRTPPLEIIADAPAASVLSNELELEIHDRRQAD